MRGFRRTLFLSHLGMVALTVLLLLVVFRNFAPTYFSGLMRERLMSHAAYARNAIGQKITDDGFDLYLTKQALAKIQRDLRQYARDNQIRVIVASRDLRVLSDSVWDSETSSTRPSQTNAPRNDDIPLYDRIEVRAALQGETYSSPRGSWRDNTLNMTLAMPIRSTRGDGEVIGCVLTSAPIRLLTPDSTLR